MAAKILVTTFDCRDAVATSRFWADALRYEVNDAGSKPPEWIELCDPAGEGHPLLFINVPEQKTVKNRVHLDLGTDLPMADEVERLVTAGAKVGAVHEHPPGYIDDPYEWTVMLDPEGNEFCIGRPLAPS